MRSLYYEAHVTIEPVWDERLAEFKRIAEDEDFRVADLLMQKRVEDTPERSKFDSFCTGRNNDRHALTGNMIRLILNLKAAGFQVWRYKIEDTLMDSRYQDVLDVITKKGSDDGGHTELQEGDFDQPTHESASRVEDERVGDADYPVGSSHLSGDDIGHGRRCRSLWVY
jgi:hypothetical protein